MNNTLKSCSRTPKWVGNDPYRLKAFNALRAMNDRCTKNTLDKDFANYYGRGIRVCITWRGTSLAHFVSFVSVVGLPPSFEHSLDRINNDDDYRPGNVRWATPIEQNRNRGTFYRTTGYVMYENKRDCAWIIYHVAETGPRKHISHHTSHEKAIEEFNRLKA